MNKASYMRSYMRTYPRRSEHREKERLRRRHQREILALVKITAGCQDCGYDSHSEALDFDHNGNPKIRGVTEFVGCSWKRIWAEVLKCDVVCANCHRVRTHSLAA